MYEYGQLTNVLEVLSMLFRKASFLAYRQKVEM